MLSDRNLLKREQCSKLAVLSNLQGNKDKIYYNAILIKDLFKTYSILDLERKEVQEVIDDFAMPFSYSKITTKLNENILISKLLRYSEFESKLDKTLLRKGNSTLINIDGNDIKVNFDFILKDSNDIIEVCKVKNGKSKLKQRGKSNLTCISKSLELFLLQKAGEELYPDKKVYGKIVYLTGVKDKNNHVDKDFEVKKFQNIAIHSFDEKETIDMEQRIRDLFSNKKDCTNIKCTDCSMYNFCNFSTKEKLTLKTINAVSKADRKVKFSKEQQEFIDTTEGFIRVIAGAGSGKTTVVSNRIINLINKGYSLGNILLITYTTKGVEELREKISYWINKNRIKVNLNNLNIFTFNSFGFELIKKEYSRFGYTEEPTIIDKITKIEIIKDILDEYPIIEKFNYLYPFMDLFNAKGVVIKIAEIFDFIKSEGVITPDEIILKYKDISEGEANTIIDMYLEYKDTLLNKNLIDFYDQVNLLYEIVSDKDLLKKYGYQHIIVDEAQDTDVLQMQVLSKMSEHYMFKSLAICGDDSQAIFSWRGADNSNIINFNKYFDGVKDIQMVENYRSTKEICEFANNINDLNENKINKKAFSNRRGKKPLLVSGGVKEISEFIKEDLDNGFKPQDIAVICRTKDLLLSVQNELSSIPNSIAVSELLIDNKNVQNLLGFTNFLINPALTLHFAEYLQIVKYDELTNATNLNEFIEQEKELFLKTYSALDSDKARIKFFYSILEEIGNKDIAVNRLLTECKKYLFDDLYDLSKFLNKFIPYKSDIFIEKDNLMFEAVTLTTFHSSKGKEFKKVYLSTDKFKYTGVQLQDEEIRRLLYVGITRAKEELVIVNNTSNEIYSDIKDALA